MTNHSTLSAQVNEAFSDKPRQSTILFIRQFARVYFHFDPKEFSPIVVN